MAGALCHCDNKKERGVAPVTDFLDSNSTVSAVPAADYAPETMARVVAEHFRLWQAETFLKPGMSVCLKPNLLMRAEPEKGITTHPQLVKAVVRQLQAMGIADITIADSPGGPYTRTALDMIYRASGMAAVAEETGAKLNSDTGFAACKAPNGVICREFNIINPIAQADVVINLPKLKTHGMVTLSAGVKNLFGCVPGLQKPEFHYRFKETRDFCQMLVDLAGLVAPQLTIVDAVEAMEGNGPSGGQVRHTGMTFGGRQPYAMDMAICDFIGLDPDRVWTVRCSREVGLCPRDMGDLQWLGTRPEPVRDFCMPESRALNFSSHVPRFARRLAVCVLEKIWDTRPVIDTDKCIGCGKCAESCAPAAAIILDGKAVLDSRKCIKCYCCHEMCPVQAINIRKRRER